MNSAVTPEIVEIDDVALSFPALPPWSVGRDNLLNTIDQIFNREFEVVLIDGPPSTGKTYALAQFCRRHSAACFSLFLKPASEVAYDSAYCRMDLCNQIHWHLHGTTLPDNADTSGAEYRILLHRLSNTARRKRREYYFVIDGLADIPKTAAGARALLVDLLPLGLPGIKCLVAGNLASIPEFTQRKLRCREQEIAPFSLEETIALFSGVRCTPERVIDLHKRFGSSPGKLASLRRLFALSTANDSVLDKVDAAESNVLELEWDSVTISDERLRLALATLVFVPSVASLDMIASVCDWTLADLTAGLLQVPYVVIDVARGTAALTPEFRGLASTRLADLSKQVLDKCVDVLSKRPIDAYTAQALPELLEKQGNRSGLIRFLSRDNIESMFRVTNSLVSILRRLDRGASMAAAADDLKQAIQFSLDRGAIRELLQSDFVRGHLGATYKILGSTEALRLANRAITVEDRLHALSEVGKLQKLADCLDPTLVAEVEGLCNRVGTMELGERAVEIASAIMYFAPQLALDLLQRSTGTPDDANGLDSALTSISIHAYLNTKDRSSTVSALRSMLPPDQSDQADRFSLLLGLFATDLSAETVIQEADKLSRTGEKLSILQQWIRGHYREDQALVVARKIIAVILDDSSYAPNASLLRDVTLPLAAGRHPLTDTGDIISMVKSYGAVLKTVGPIVDYYRMRFHVARTQALGAGSSSLAPFDEDAIELVDQKDLITRVSCFAWLHASIVSDSRLMQASDPLGIASFAQEQLRDGVRSLLSQSAEHTEVIRPIIQALAGVADSLLSELIAGVNLPERRDECFKLAARRARNNPYWTRTPEGARASFRHYEALCKSHEVIDGLRVEYLRWIVNMTNARVVEGQVTAVELDLASQIADPLMRIDVAGDLISSGNLAHDESMLNFAIKIIQSAVEDAETPLRKRMGRLAASGAFALVRPTLARQLFDQADGHKCNTDHTDAVTTVGLEVLRTYSGLVRMRVSTDFDWSKTRAVLDVLASPFARCQLGAKLALLVWAVQPEHAREIATRYVRSTIQRFVETGQVRQPVIAELTVVVAPALWVIHPAQAKQLLVHLDSRARDEAYDNILGFVLEGRLVDEPFRAPKDANRDLPEETISDAIDMLREVQSDSVFTRHATTILRAMRDRAHYRGRISKIQVQEIRRQLDEMARAKLPCPTGIGHEGYLILVDAEFLAGEKSPDGVWDSVIDRAKSLPNTADSAFVCASLLRSIPSRNDKPRSRAFEAAASLITQLPLMEDKVDRTYMLLEEGWNINPERCKRIARDTFEVSLSADRAALRQRRLKLIEAVYPLDADLAGSLASLVEKQETASIAKFQIKDRLRSIKLTAELSTDRPGAEAEADLDDLASAASDALAKLNGGAIVTAPIGQLRQLLLRTGEASFTDSAPIHDFVCEAIVQRYRNSADGPEYVRDLFDQSVLTFDLLSKLASSLDNHDIGRPTEESSERQGTFIVRPGTRGDSLSWIAAWLRTNQPADLVLVDPYFGPSDLRAVMLLQQEVPSCTCTIITAAKTQAAKTGGGYKTQYDEAWHGFSLGEPPDTRIIIVSSDGDITALLHDRWWLGERSGIGLGTSFNSLGDKYSELHELSASAATALRREMQPYLELARRTATGVKLSCEAFNLC